MCGGGDVHEVFQAPVLFGISKSPIFAAPNWLTVPPMPCSIAQGVWVVCLPFCEDISRSRARNTPGVFRGQSRPCSVFSEARRAATHVLSQRLPCTRVCAITLPNGRGTEQKCLTLRSPRDAE